MPIEDHLDSLKNKVDEELKVFFDNKIKQIKNQKKPDELLEMTENVKDFILRSGKRIRPILFYCGYIIAGGKDREKILKAAISVELIHSFLLIHDDIIDQDNFRHGGLSMHCSYKNKYKNKNKNSKHFEISMAIIVGDLAYNFGYEILAESNFSSDLKIKTIRKMNQIISNTASGEAADVELSVNSNFDTDKIIEMQKYKTAKYTIEGPLHLGAVLAGADEKFLKNISKFAIPLGIAFQIQDDIIGVFGDEQKIGKPVGSDIEEGKKTLLIAKAIEQADNEQKEILINLLGNAKINLKEIEKVREIIIKTGSLEHSQKIAGELIKTSKKRLEEMKILSQHQGFLNDLADFIVGREH